MVGVAGSGAGLMNEAEPYSHKLRGSPMLQTPCVAFIIVALTYHKKIDGFTVLCKIGTPLQSCGS